ncbi:hypothetical protein BJ085DRAFT_32465 [Dimargaris cristalligena]|uniref:SWI/SNF and RSC complexes subunit Ssr4 C-terminal domain-containing protein n=1 Tax=Dimargaris cristalligena TaxID=215637 RepID=A0A4P9ZMA3_9FUNG|nr:hypothetical protein BJ085DRAFT_32465 [Dimargaris cristalligena]|eukprot:RKP33671.1 hypothetical protein BJ085DRAFT_32465 [Dimargaris cristalligena]
MNNNNSNAPTPSANPGGNRTTTENMAAYRAINGQTRPMTTVPNHTSGIMTGGINARLMNQMQQQMQRMPQGNGMSPAPMGSTMASPAMPISATSASPSVGGRPNLMAPGMPGTMSPQTNKMGGLPHPGIYPGSDQMGSPAGITSISASVLSPAQAAAAPSSRIPGPSKKKPAKSKAHVHPSSHNPDEMEQLPGDEFDTIKPIELAIARYVRNHEYMADIFSVVPVDKIEIPPNSWSLRDPKTVTAEKESLETEVERIETLRKEALRDFQTLSSQTNDFGGQVDRATSLNEIE